RESPRHDAAETPRTTPDPPGDRIRDRAARTLPRRRPPADPGSGLRPEPLDVGGRGGHPRTSHRLRDARRDDRRRAMNARGDDGTGSELRHSTALLDVFATLAD